MRHMYINYKKKTHNGNVLRFVKLYSSICKIITRLKRGGGKLHSIAFPRHFHSKFD
jgi:hypothetical protein